MGVLVVRGRRGVECVVCVAVLRWWFFFQDGTLGGGGGSGGESGVLGVGVVGQGTSVSSVRWLVVRLGEGEEDVGSRVRGGTWKSYTVVVQCGGTIW
jgi:hypothetical protein